MGAWGVGSFQNDQALEWLGEMESEDDTTLIEDALGTITEADEGAHLDADECNVAIAAAELVAAMGGQPSKRLPDGMKDWCDEQDDPEPEVVADALAAIAKIRKGSELLEQYTEGGKVDVAWEKSLDDLVKRLNAANTAEV